jgi:uncharacterized membrane protein
VVVLLVLTVPLVIIMQLILSAIVVDPVAPSDTLNFTTPIGFQIVNYIIQIFYFTPLTIGLFFVFMKAARGQNVEIGSLFEAFRNYGNVLIVGILYTLFSVVSSLIIGFLAIAIPVLGIIIALAWIIAMIIIGCRLSFVPYLLTDRKMNAIDSITTSWQWTNGHAGEVFLIGLLSFPIIIAGFICLVIGIIPAAMWVYTALGSLYHAVSREKIVAEEAMSTPIRDI